MNGNLSESEEKRILYGRIEGIPGIDETLTKRGMSADARATGDSINTLKNRLDTLDPHYASAVRYDNTASGLESSQLQAVIDEIARTYAKVTALDGYLPLTGGTINGNTYESFNVNNTAGEAVYVGFYGEGELNGLLGMKGKDNPMFCNTAGEVKELHHAGNKPLGTYTGDGSSTLRTIETGGIGKLLLIYSANGVAFVVPRGAVKIAGSTISWLTSSTQYYGDGILRMATTDAVFNAKDVVYTYQVI